MVAATPAGPFDGEPLQLTVESRPIAITNPSRALWPAVGFTKAALVAYYVAVGSAMLPHLVRRPLLLGRWPQGVDARGWGQFQCRGRPAWMASYRLELKTGKVVETCIVNDVASLAWIAGQGTIELHAYLAREPQLDQPTAVVFDLDPGPPAGLLEACAVAVRLRDRLAELGLAAFAKTSGGSGLHVFVPLNTPASYTVTKRFARDLAGDLAARHPELVVNRMSRTLRTGRVFIDWGQNDERKQTIAPYSLRATPTPLVSAPVRWDEVDAAVGSRSAARLRFAPSDVRHRLEAIGDPFGPVAELTQRLPAT